MAKIDKAKIIQEWKSKEKLGLDIARKAEECLKQRDYEFFDFASILYIHASTAFLRAQTKKAAFSGNENPMIFCLNMHLKSKKKMLEALEQTAETSKIANEEWMQMGEDYKKGVENDTKYVPIIAEKIDLLWNILTSEGILSMLEAGGLDNKAFPTGSDEFFEEIKLRSDDFVKEVTSQCEKYSLSKLETAAFVDYLGALFVYSIRTPEQLEASYRDLAGRAKLRRDMDVVRKRSASYRI
ncbi:MAG: hypothetical protein ABH829_05440 [archaeon]